MTRRTPAARWLWSPPREWTRLITFRLPGSLEARLAAVGRALSAATRSATIRYVLDRGLRRIESELRKQNRL